MPKYKLISIGFSGTSGASGPSNTFGNPLLFIITGTRKEVIMNTGCLTEFYNSGYEKSKKIIITDQGNMDIFANLPKTKIYPMNPETFLILDQKFFWKIIMIPGTELSHAFCEKRLNRSGSLSSCVTTEEFPDWKYYFNQTPHPIDIVHYRIKRKGSYLIGINIGECEHVTKKLPYTFLDDLMKNLSNKIDVKFVLFGTKLNQLREQMIKRDNNVTFISMVEDFDCHIIAQAISMCDCFISLNSFLLHLSIAVKQDTIGMFYRNELKENEIMLPNLYPFVVEKKCDECNEDEECEFIYKCDECCLESFNAKDIGFMAINILNSKGE